MEIMLMELSSFAATAFHAIMGFGVWLCVITTTAALMVYNRVSKELMDVVNFSDDPDNDNTRGHAHTHYKQLQPIKVEKDRAS